MIEPTERSSSPVSSTNVIPLAPSPTTAAFRATFARLSTWNTAGTKMPPTMSTMKSRITRSPLSFLERETNPGPVRRSR